MNVTFTVRRVANYVDVQVRCDERYIDLGLHTPAEAEHLLENLREAVGDLEHWIAVITPFHEKP